LGPNTDTQLFTGGLPEHIRVDIELHEPTDLHRAMRLARAFERCNAAKAPALPSALPLLAPCYDRPTWGHIVDRFIDRSIFRPPLQILDTIRDG
jgi:hypothetical protein